MYNIFIYLGTYNVHVYCKLYVATKVLILELLILTFIQLGQGLGS